MKLQDKKIVFSGFRDEHLKSFIEENGGKVTTSISGKTDILVVKSLEKMDTKRQKAEDLGKKVISLDAFMKAMGNSNLDSNAKSNANFKSKKVSKSAPKAVVASTTYATIFKNYLPDNGENIPTVAQVEKALGVSLKHGDCVHFSKHRHNDTYIVYKIAEKQRFIKNPDNFDSGYLSIPLKISKHIPDNVKYYSKIIKSEGVIDIELPATDAFIAKRFKTSSPIQDHAKFRYTFFDGAKSLNVTYNNHTETFNLPITQKKVQKAFDNSNSVKVCISVAVTVQSSRNAKVEFNSNAKVNWERLKPSKSWKVSHDGLGCVKFEGPQSEFLDLKEKLARLYFSAK